MLDSGWQNGAASVPRLSHLLENKLSSNVPFGLNSYFVNIVRLGTSLIILKNVIHNFALSL